MNKNASSCAEVQRNCKYVYNVLDKNSDVGELKESNSKCVSLIEDSNLFDTCNFKVLSNMETKGKCTLLLLCGAILTGLAIGLYFHFKGN